MCVSIGGNLRRNGRKKERTSSELERDDDGVVVDGCNTHKENPDR